MPPSPTHHGGKGGRLEGSLPLRIVTSVRTVPDYVRGTRHRPKSRMEPWSTSWARGTVPKS